VRCKATIQRRLGDRSREAMAVDGAGEAYREMGQPDEAVSFHLRAAATHRQLDDDWELAVTLDHLALALVAAGRAEAAHRHWQEADTLLARFDDPRAAALRHSIAARRLGDAGPQAAG
jgi:tetratricopeptide (TPR) repeat protein